MGKKRFFVSHAKSSAMLISVAIHAVLIVVAIFFVAVKVIVKEDTVFVEQRVKRPKMPPKKIQVPVDAKKSKPKPKLRRRIVSERKMADIKMPEITGVKGGLGNMGGDGLGSLGFDMEIGDLFGSNKSMGDELTGTFFDLKQTDKGEPTEIGKLKTAGKVAIGPFFTEMAKFINGWRTSRLKNYYQAPKKKYTTFFMIPMANSSRATEAFGVAEYVKPSYWAAYYEGHISAPESGRYRFHGYGDDILLVRINKREVLDAGFEPYKAKLRSGWKSDDDNNRKYPIGRKSDRLYIGDWFRMTKGQAVRMEVLIGDVGGECSSHLLIEQEGQKYKQAPYSYKIKVDGVETVVSGTRPVLPIFKTREIPKELHRKMNVSANEVTLSGPVFGAGSAEPDF